MSSSRLRSHLLVLAAVCLSLFAPRLAAAQRRPEVPHKPPVENFIVQGDRFLVDRGQGQGLQREFLVFISYFDALTAAENKTLEADLEYIADHGFTGIRVFGTWHDMSRLPDEPGCIVPFGLKNLFDQDGNVRLDRLALLIDVIDRAHAKGLIVDVSFDHGTVGDITQFTFADYKKALTSIAGTLSSRRNVLFDLQNEFDLGDVNFPTHLSYAQVKELRIAVKAADPNRIVTASTTYPTETNYANGTAEMAWEAGLDVVAHHEPREDDWWEADTATTVVGGLRWMPSGASSPKPVYLQEPRPYKHTAELCEKSEQSDTSTDRAAHQRSALINAKAAGAAAWLFHIEHGFVLKNSSFVSNINAEPGLRDLIEGTAADEKLALSGGGTNPPNPTEISLLVDLEGDGTGRITGTGIDCTGTGPDCLQTYSTTGTSVTLTAAADPGVSFGGWTVNGDLVCGVALTCQVTVNGYTQVRAWFNLVRDDTVEYLHHDAFGSVRHVTNAAGTTVGMYNYRPFGEQEDANLPSQQTGHATPRKFAGKERDTGTGFDYFGARYHMAVFGRFTTVDPVVPIDAALHDPQLWNRYAYVRNNPLRFSDPDGRCIWDLCAAEGTGAYLIGAAAVGTMAYLVSEPGQAAVRQVAIDTGAMITTAAGAISSWFSTESRPGRLGRPDHKNTVEEEADKLIDGETEVRIPTPGGKKDFRVADAFGKDPATGAPTIVQVYRPKPTKAGGVPSREYDAKTDIENSPFGKAFPDLQVILQPVRPVPPKPEPR